MANPYVLEVQKFASDAKVAIEMRGKYTHIGYMYNLFPSKQEACDYYDIHNKHMRSLNAHGTWRSDWDPETRFRYVIREYDGETRTIQPFAK